MFCVCSILYRHTRKHARVSVTILLVGTCTDNSKIYCTLSSSDNYLVSENIRFIGHNCSKTISAPLNGMIITLANLNQQLQLYCCRSMPFHLHWLGDPLSCRQNKIQMPNKYKRIHITHIQSESHMHTVPICRLLDKNRNKRELRNSIFGANSAIHTFSFWKCAREFKQNEASEREREKKSLIKNF